MQQLEQILTFILDHKELIGTFLATLLAIIKLTSWGRPRPRRWMRLSVSLSEWEQKRSRAVSRPRKSISKPRLRMPFVTR